MVKTFVTLALFGGVIGLLGVLFSPTLAMLGLIGLACLCAILARIAQASDHREAMDRRLNALFKLVEKIAVK